MAPTLPVESERGADGLDDALADPGAAIAIVSAPFAGRDAILDDAAEMVGSPERTRLEPGDGPDDIPAFGNRPVIVDDCHHLYTRRIDGFDPLDAFLDRLVDASARVVTSWNRFSWRYLDAVYDLSDAFRHVFAVSSLSGDRLAAELRAEYGALPAFESPGQRASPLRTVEYAVRIPTRDPVSLRVPTIDVDYVTAVLRGGEQPSAKELVFERLRRLSDGNRGVAAAVWESCLDGTPVALDDLQLPVDRSTDPGDDAVSVLRVVVSKEAVARDELAAVVADVPLDRTLHTLAERGFVSADEVVSLRPGSLPSAMASLERRRWLW